jgi:hypothetical protein
MDRVLVATPLSGSANPRVVDNPSSHEVRQRYLGADPESGLQSFLWVLLGPALSPRLG